MAGPYDGLCIVDLAAAMPGSYAAMILAELGGDVVKVEGPTGNPLRGQPAFHVFNRSKRSLLADVETTEGRKVVLDLLARADIVVVDYLPAEETALRLEYDRLAAHNPRLIYCAVPPMGSEGPLANTPRYDDLVMAHSGLMWAQWAAREGPVYQILPMGSYGAAFLAVGAVGAALRVRDRTGRGQRVEVSWLAGAMAMSIMHIVTPENPQESRWDRDPQGGISPAYRLYECRDGKWLDIACATITFFNKLCIALDITELVGDPRFENAPWGIDRQDRPFLLETLARTFKTRTRDEWIRLLQQADVPCSPVMTREEVINDPQVIHNRMRVEVEDPELGRTVQFGVPLRMSLTPPGIKGPAPLLGEHGGESPSATWTANPVCQTANMVSPEAPLGGLRVLDLAAFGAGPLVSRALADMGADVVKIEPPSGDPARAVGHSFASTNRGKRGIVIDLGMAEGRELVHELVRNADVVCYNFRPGVARRLGVDYVALRQVNPRIIVQSGTGWGTDGPYAALPGYDPLASARAGLMQAQGGHGHPPVYNYIGCMDHGASLVGAYGVLAALYHRERSGLGQLVETSLLNIGLAVQAAHFIFYDGKPADPEGGPDLLGVSALQRLYRANDAWLLVVATSEVHWRALARVLGRPDLVDQYPAADALRAEREGHLAADLASIFATQSAEHWLAALRQHQVPAAAALDFADLPRDPQVVANQIFLLEDQPLWGRLWLPVNLAKFSACPPVGGRPAPGKGEHSVEVLEELGLDAGRIAELRERRVVLQAVE